MNKFCANVKEYATEIINCKKENFASDKERKNIIQKIKILSHTQRRIHRKI